LIPTNDAQVAAIANRCDGLPLSALRRAIRPVHMLNAAHSVLELPPEHALDKVIRRFLSKRLRTHKQCKKRC
jgi:hypothetical protein